MKKALVLGATGGMGSALVKELVSREIQVVAFARNKGKLEQLAQGNKLIQVFKGDVFEKEDLLTAAADVDHIYHSVNIPYPEWAEKQPLLMNNILETAKERQLKLAIVDNIYAYGRANGEPIDEKHPKQPHTKKGKIRLQLETMAKQSGVPVLIAHFPDFYGPDAGNTLLNYLFDAVIKNKKAMHVGDQKIAREYLYTPDGAKALVDLSLHDQAYGQNWNIPGAGTITGVEIVKLVKEYTGYNRKISTVTKNMIRFVGLFDRFMREYLEMYYLNEEPVILKGDKYEQYIGKLPRTPYEEGIRETLNEMRGSKP